MDIDKDVGLIGSHELQFGISLCLKCLFSVNFECILIWRKQRLLPLVLERLRFRNFEAVIKYIVNKDVL